MAKSDLKELVKKSGYRTDFIADQVGVTAKTLRGIISGKQATSRSVVKLLAQVLNTSEDVLLDELKVS